MRIRLRVPRGGKENSSGPSGWFQRFRDSFNGSSAPPGKPPFRQHQQVDKRWTAHGDAKYFFEGRHCRNIAGAWHSEYVFTILAAAELWQIRVVLPEAPITAWEQQHNQRMSEDQRLRLARETMETLVGRNSFPAAITVSAETITAASKV